MSIRPTIRGVVLALALIAMPFVGAAVVVAQNPGPLPTGGPFGSGPATVNNAGHISVGNYPAPVLSSCGTNPTVFGTDIGFKVLPGPTATACTATFNAAWNNPPICSVDAESYTLAYLVTATQVQMLNVLPGIFVHVQCMGRPGG